MFIIKKDGYQSEFDDYKIFQSVFSAAKRVRPDSKQYNEDLAKSIEKLVLSKIQDNNDTEITTTYIQKVVENNLMDKDKEIAIAYIEYRNKQDIQRKGMTDISKSVAQVLSKDEKIINENANKDGNKFPVIRDLTVGNVAKAMALKHMLPKRVAKAHIKGDIHFHDLDYHPFAPLTNCCLINFKDMFENGTKIGAAKINPPKSINTAVALTSQIVANVASNQYGGCSFNRMDEVLAPYAKLNYEKHMKDAETYNIPEPKKYAKEKTAKDIFDSIQGLEYEINTLYSSNGQTAFFSVGFGLGTDWFSREIQKAILKNRMAGLGDGRVAIFPKLIFTIKEGLNRKPNDPNYDIKKLALECTSKCIYPDILNYDKIKEITGSFKAPMGCRSFLQSWKDKNGNEVSDGRMNLGVTTINLPRIAMESNKNKKRFWKIFYERMDVMKEACDFRIRRVQDAQPINAPILYEDGAFGRLKKDDNVFSLMNHRRATISLGYIGLYEVGTAFYGPEWEHNREAKEFTLEILKRMNELAKKWSDETDVHFSVYGTPSESLTDTFCRLDREKFGLVKDITDKEYYTNSFHYDTRKHVTPFEKIDFEKEYCPLSSGGVICYVELANARQNLTALEQVWDYSYDRIGYFGVNTPIDKCFACGYRGEFKATDKGYECPQCGNTDPDKADVVKRMCGYLGQPLARPEAHGRHKEIQSRVKHDI